MASKQTGVVVLILCHFFLVAALSLALAGNTGIFELSTSIQNETIYRQKFWLAEGGLECAFSLFANQSVASHEQLLNLNLPYYVAECVTASLQVVWVQQSLHHYKVTSTVDNISLSRELVVTTFPTYSAAWNAGSWTDNEPDN
ncbi:hypothetical protein [Vibrio sp. MA40-2]|uniref:hypothetical protein n=1 Tax=Vibrio sp. MA40-2 TaxID=3391828 RepID=UPI0039A76BBC